jgi:hypothetical protein
MIEGSTSTSRQTAMAFKSAEESQQRLPIIVLLFTLLFAARICCAGKTVVGLSGVAPRPAEKDDGPPVVFCLID